MGEKRKMRCDCGGAYETRTVDFRGFKVEGLVCERCQDTVFTVQQSKRVFDLAKKHGMFGRKVIKVGDSLAVTIPKTLTEFGWKEGMQVKVICNDERSFTVEMA